MISEDQERRHGIRELDQKHLHGDTDDNNLLSMHKFGSPLLKYNLNSEGFKLQLVWDHSAFNSSVYVIPTPVLTTGFAFSVGWYL